MIKASVFCLLYALLNVSGAAIIKWKLKGKVLNEFNDWMRFLFSFHVIGAFILIFISALVLFKALSLGNFTYIIPVSVGINFILTVIAGFLIFSDKINLISVVGFCLIISGILLLSLNTSEHA